MDIRDQFISFARYLACPYVTNLDAVKPYVNSISVVLVGSVASGICNSQSNVDLCILCSRDTYNLIYPNVEWNAGKYVEMAISGVKTRYYLEIVDNVLEGLNKLDDLTYYLYTSAIPLDDISGAFKQIQKYIAEQKLVERHQKHVYNHMLKRRRSLSSYLDEYRDPFGRLMSAQDALRCLIRGISVYDNVPFDPKKHPYETALSGQTGKYLKPCIDELLNLMSRLAVADDTAAQKDFLRLIDNCISVIS